MRLRYIDLTKGFAIILMLWGHTMTSVNGIHIWIYSFHMPIFFIMCGILIRIKEEKIRGGTSIRKCNNSTTIHSRNSLFHFWSGAGRFLFDFEYFGTSTDIFGVTFI